MADEEQQRETRRLSERGIEPTKYVPPPPPPAPVDGSGIGTGKVVGT